MLALTNKAKAISSPRQHYRGIHLQHEGVQNHAVSREKILEGSALGALVWFKQSNHKMEEKSLGTVYRLHTRDSLHLLLTASFVSFLAYKTGLQY